MNLARLLTRARARRAIAIAALSVVGWSCGLGLTGNTNEASPLAEGGASLPETSSSIDGSNDQNASTTDVVVPVGEDAAVVEDGSTDSGNPIPGPATSCKDLRDRGTTANGLHQITLPRGVVEVWCDMAFQGGGFTLVGRSGAASGSTPFGWRVSTGSPGNKIAAYSMDARGLAFTEVLLADKPGISDLVSTGVIVRVPANFVEDFQTTRFDLRTIVENPIAVVVGGCNTTTHWTDGTQMVRRLGHTNRTDNFFVRDVDTEGGFGLTPSRWELSDEGCARSFDLHQEDGAIYVR